MHHILAVIEREPIIAACWTSATGSTRASAITPLRIARRLHRSAALGCA
jgi:hypothetical protein